MARWRTTYAQWARDGRIVFGAYANLDGSDLQGAANLWVASPDGSVREPLTDLDGPPIELFNFSVTADAVFYSSHRGLEEATRNELRTANGWRVSLDGASNTPLTQNTFASSHLVQASPDGREVLFVSRRNLDGSNDQGPTQIVWRVRPDGSELLPLTQSEGAESYTAVEVSND